MGSALLTFLGSAAFRLLISFFMDRLKDWQEYGFEQGRIRLQAELEALAAKRELESLAMQKDLGIDVIRAERSNELYLEDLTSFNKATDNVYKETGHWTLDIWNSSVRPLLACTCIAAWVFHIIMNNGTLNAWDLELISATLGVFVGTRITQTGR
jgi:hypothetical protein